MTRLAAALAALILATGMAAHAGEMKKLLSPSDLAAASGVRVIDIRSDREYLTGHIPGALNAPYPAWRGPAENPGQPLDDAALTALLQGLGLTPDSRVAVAHAGLDQTDFGAAARVYWTLKSAGLSEIAILNGGVRGWIADGRALSVEPATADPSTARFTLSDDWMVDRDGVAAMMSGAREGRLIDARPAEFLAGKRKHPAAKAAGTIPGAGNLQFDSWFAEGPTEMPLADKVRAMAAEAAPETGGDTVSFCNTGHWAAINWFALSELAGRDNVKLYPESMVGWTGSGGAVETRP